MSRSFDFAECEQITAGAVGEPGGRTFYLQARTTFDVATLLVEKEQVRVLCEAMMRMLEQLPELDEGVAPEEWQLALQEPVEPEWRAGQMSIEYEEAIDRVVITIEEVEDEDAPEPPATARFLATRAQARAMAEHALEVVESGRPRCQLCGYPMDPEGHVCPAMNGFRSPRT